MSRREPGIEPEVARDILRYFLRHPQAADNLEGVTRWRLLDERIHSRLEETKQVLRWLVSQGFLVEECTPLSAPVFRLNPGRRPEIERFLKRSSPTAPVKEAKSEHGGA